MKKTLTKIPFILTLVALLFMLGCKTGNNSSSDDEIVETGNNAATEATASVGDASVSAADGGPGFEAIAADSGWVTRKYDFTGNPNAPKGGSLTMAFLEYPSTFRYVGKNSNYQITRIIGDLVYEKLLYYDRENLDYYPGLASHWKISEDKATYWFRIDPRARWSDGKEVTADDVVATFKLLMDKTLEDAYHNNVWAEMFEEPVKHSKYIVSLKNKKPGWRNLYEYIQMIVYPAYHLEKVDGAGFLKKYQFEMLPGTGPYVLDKAQTKEGEVVVIKRRDDYWGKVKPENAGKYNFDELRFPIVRESNLMMQKFKADELDVYIPSRAQWWYEEFNTETNDDVKRGLTLRRKIYNYNAKGTAGLAMNTNEPPFDNIKVREAMSLLFNFEQLNDKMFFNEYVRCKSYFPNGVYEFPGNPMPTFNPEKAKQLLKEAGWEKKKGAQWLTKDGKPFELKFMSDKSLERIFVPYQEDLKKAGINLVFNNTDGNARFKKVQAKEYSIAFQAWGGLFFPDPVANMHSKFAKTKDNTNITGMNIPEIDKLAEEYDASYDGKARVKMLQTIDSIAVAQHHYAFTWMAPYTTRIMIWNKFGYPESGFSYGEDFRDIFNYWWYDAEKAKALEEAQKDKNKTLPLGEEKIDFWKKA